MIFQSSLQRYLCSLRRILRVLSCHCRPALLHRFYPNLILPFSPDCTADFPRTRMLATRKEYCVVHLGACRFRYVCYSRLCVLQVRKSVRCITHYQTETEIARIYFLSKRRRYAGFLFFATALTSYGCDVKKTRKVFFEL